MKLLVYLPLGCYLIFQNCYAQPIEVSRLDLFRENESHRSGSMSRDSSDPFILESEFLPLDKRFYPSIANGYIGHQLFSDVVFLNHLFNGKGGDSHKAQIPIQVPKPLLQELNSERFELDMRKNVFYHRSFSELIDLEQVFYAHSWYGRLLVVEISSLATRSDVVELLVDVPLHDVTSEDVTFTKTTKQTFESWLCSKPECEYLLNAHVATGHTNTAEEDFSDQQELVVISTIPPSSLRFSNSSSKHVFFFSFGSSFTEALYFYELGLLDVSSGTLMSDHVSRWGQTWRDGSVEILGSLKTDRYVKSVFYYLLSSFPTIDGQPISFPYPFYGVGPGGLARGAAGKDYQGHVFWDQDFWMIPGLLPFYPEIAKMVINYRVRNLPGALAKAASLQFEGAAYPWEAAFTGADVCPAAQYSDDEIHVTADVIHLLKQYVYVTNNYTVFSIVLPSSGCNDPLKEFVGPNSCEPIHVTKANDCVNVSAWDMLRETAQFWRSRSEWNVTLKKFVINNVMGPDEYHYPVNNSVFTNVIASQNLKFAADVAEMLGVCPDLVAAWRNVSDNLFILFDSPNSYHPEFEGFNHKKDVVKQADTIMLGFPLMLNMSDAVKKNDLTVYEEATTSEGPAMTWGMFAANWLTVAEEQKASDMFVRQFKNIQSPFNIWSENANGGGAVNFLTGMGGFVQSVVYGYFGLRINEHNLTLDPKLLPTSSNHTAEGMTMNGLRYRGLLLNINVYPSTIQVVYAGIYAREMRSETCLKVTTSQQTYTICQQLRSVTVSRSKVQLNVITS